MATAVDSSFSGDDTFTVVKKSLCAAANGFADGFMMGGIVAGGSHGCGKARCAYRKKGRTKTHSVM